MSVLKQKTALGMKWSVIERFSVQLVQLVIGVSVARILLPSDYGLIGMLSIFMAVSQLFIDGGFSSALIHKIDRTETDFSTVFYFNLVIGILLYLILVITAPYIAIFFREPELQKLTYVVALNFVINSLALIQRTKLTIELDFKAQAKVSLVSTLISGLTGLLLAYIGWGVWAIVWQMLIFNILSVVLLWAIKPWKPLLAFSFQSFRLLFGFGSKLLCANLIDTIYNNVYQLIIGRLYSKTILGYYTRAQQFAGFTSLNINGIIQRVTYPILCEIQDDNDRLKRFFCRFLRMTVFVVFPLAIGLAILARPLIMCILTSKWEGAIPLLQLLCIAYMFYPIHSLNINLLQVKGRTDWILKIEILKKLFITLVVIVTIYEGVWAICAGMILTSVIALIINTYYSGKLIDFGLWKQMKEILPILGNTAFMAIVVYGCIFLLESDLLKLIIGIVAGVVSYCGCAYLFRFPEINEIMNFFLRKKIDF